MIHSGIDSETQAGICIVDKTDDFFKQCDIASTLPEAPAGSIILPAQTPLMKAPLTIGQTRVGLFSST